MVLRKTVPITCEVSWTHSFKWASKVNSSYTQSILIFLEYFPYFCMTRMEITSVEDLGITGNEVNAVIKNHYWNSAGLSISHRHLFSALGASWSGQTLSAFFFPEEWQLPCADTPSKERESESKSQWQGLASALPINPDWRLPAFVGLDNKKKKAHLCHY